MMLRLFSLRVGRLRRRLFSGLLLFLVTFFLGYLQYQYIRESAAQHLLEHLQHYYHVCQNQTGSHLGKSQKLCPCLPHKNWIVSEEHFSQNTLDYSAVDADLANVKNGSWRPPDCVARQRIAIVIPAKNRDNHLHTLLRHLHPFLQSQFVEYSIYVVDQTSPSLYNKAASMNAAYLELKKRAAKSNRPLNCVIFHDVDQIPMDNRNMYTCFYSPLHLGGYRSTDSNERGKYIDSFGGVTSLSVEHFEAVNGYSNNFWGWGGEDANLGRRVQNLNKQISVYPPTISQTFWIRHDKDSTNPVNYNRQWDSQTFFEDGLSTLKYRLTHAEHHQLYTKFHVDLDPLIDDERCKSRPDVDNVTTSVNCINRENIASGNTYCCSNSEGAAFCCGKPLYMQWKIMFTSSNENHPYRWSLVYLAIIIVVVLLRTFYNPHRETKS